MNDSRKVPAAAAGVTTDTRIIFGNVIRCVDGRWSTAGDGIEVPKGTKLLVLGTTDLLQRWQDGRVVEVIRNRPLPGLESLNAKIPLSEWDTGIDGKPRAPWQHTFCVYLLDPETAERYTFANATVGARIAVEDLAEKMRWMRGLRGAQVTASVELSSKPMKTRFGVKLRPHFKLLKWMDLGSIQLTAEPATPMIGGPEIAEVDPPTEEVLDDSIPF
jgi:hypothetical protein